MPGSVGDRGEQGLRGHKGEKGERGKPGHAKEPTIKLPVHVVTITGDWRDIVNTRRWMGLVKDFWAELGIDVQDSHSINDSGRSLTYEDDSVAMWHLLYQPFVSRLTLYIDPQAQSVGLGYMGQVAGLTGAYGTAIIAGAHGDAYTAAIINHEIGHWMLVGENEDHVAGTFLDAIIDPALGVADSQKEGRREGAYKWGGY